jgi:hypothetical protein
MDKEQERAFLEVYSRALVSLPFDIKMLVEAVSDADLETDVRELTAAAVVHVIAPKDGNVEPVLRHAEDLLLVRLALRHIVAEGGEGAETYKERFRENYDRLDEEMATFEGAFGAEVVSWLDGRWPALRKVVYVRKKIPEFVQDDEVANFLYEEGLRFGTEYPITEKWLVGRVKQAQPIIDHLVRKREQDKKKITHP